QETDCLDAAILARLVGVSEGEASLELRRDGALLDRFEIRVAEPAAREIAVYSLEAKTEDGFVATRETELETGAGYVARIEAVAADGTALLVEEPTVWIATDANGALSGSEVHESFLFSAPEEPGSLMLEAGS